MQNREESRRNGHFTEGFKTLCVAKIIWGKGRGWGHKYFFSKYRPCGKFKMRKKYLPINHSSNTSVLLIYIKFDLKHVL
jgi:hypothetical protein